MDAAFAILGYGEVVAQVRDHTRICEVLNRVIEKVHRCINSKFFVFVFFSVSVNENTSI